MIQSGNFVNTPQHSGGLAGYSVSAEAGGINKLYTDCAAPSETDGILQYLDALLNRLQKLNEVADFAIDRAFGASPTTEACKGEAEAEAFSAVTLKAKVRSEVERIELAIYRLSNFVG